MPRSDVRRIFEAAEQLGFPEPELRSAGHYMTTHPVTGQTAFFPATPSDYRSVANVLAELQRAAGQRLAKPRGYAGGKRFSPQRPADMYSRTVAEQYSSAMREHSRGMIEDFDVELRDLVERIELDDRAASKVEIQQIKALLISREHYAARLRDYSGVPPELDIPGLDVLVSTAPDDTPASADDLTQLREKYSD